MGTPNKYPPFIALSDFQHLNASLETQDRELRELPEGQPRRLRRPGERPEHRPSATNAKKAGYTDTNGDGYIDEYDLFVKQYDANGDRAIAKPEFTNAATGQLYDPACSRRSTRSAGR